MTLKCLVQYWFYNFYNNNGNDVLNIGPYRCIGYIGLNSRLFFPNTLSKVIHNLIYVVHSKFILPIYVNPVRTHYVVYELENVAEIVDCINTWNTWRYVCGVVSRCIGIYMHDWRHHNVVYFTPSFCLIF